MPEHSSSIAGRDDRASLPGNEARLRDLLGWSEARLRVGGIDAPRREARMLLAHALGIRPVSLIGIGPDEVVHPVGFAGLVDRRAAREPLAFLIGRQGFWTLDLAVSPATLIPRADSETLIEALLEARPEAGPVRRLLDLGTGTGCLLLAALSEYPQAWGVGVDVSEAACRLAVANAASAGVGARFAAVCGDWLGAIAAGVIGGGFDVILSNPPYVPAAEVAGLMPEVSLHEPRRALDGGPDGLDIYRRLLPALAPLLSPGGLVVFEVGVGQAGAVVALGGAAGLRPISVRADLAGVPRAVLLGRAA